MKTRKIPLYDLKLPKRTIKEVNDVLESGWLTTGPKVQAFEKAVAAALKVRYVAAVSSATAGLQVALEALGTGQGGRVITSPFTFVASVEAILRAGGMPVFADIDPVTLNIDPDEVVRKLDPKTNCVVPVDIAGQLADYPRLVEICDQHKLPLIADASHSFGATLKRKATAQWADAAIYSCHATKNLTCGEGGLVASRHKILRESIKLASMHCMTSSAYQRRQTSTWEYDVVDLGAKANMSDVHAAIGLGQLSVFEKNQAKRVKIAARYEKNLVGLAEHLETPPVHKGHKHAWHLYIIRLHLSGLKIDRAEFINLMAEAGVGCGVHYKPLTEMSYYRQLGFEPKHFPNTTYIGQRVVSLPMYPELKLSDVDYVCERATDIITGSIR